MKKTKNVMSNKNIQKIIMLALVIIMCFSPIVNAGLSLYTEQKEDNRGGDGVTLVTRKTVLLISTDDAQSAVLAKGTKTEIVNGTEQTYNWSLDLSYPNRCTTGEEVTQQPTFTYESADGREYSGPVTKMNFVVMNDDGTYSSVAGMSSVYYQESQGFVIHYTGDLTSGTEIFVEFAYVDADGKEQIVRQPAGVVGSSIPTSVHEITQSDPGWLSVIWNLVVDTFSEVARLVEEVTVELLLPLGDGILYVITTSVGESVTMDRLVFNGVGKVNIDFWSGIVPGSKDVKAVMAKVVHPWYNLFYKVAIIVYMVCLVIVGIQVLLNSTADKKAKYKEVMVSWVTGVVILTMFPFVMKYVVQINNAGIAAMYSYLFPGKSMSEKYIPELIRMDVSHAMKTFGTSYFVDYMVEEQLIDVATKKLSSAKLTDSMLMTRLRAQYNKKIALVGIYFIMLGQMIVLLFMYYKRAFMLAFLITIFPLVAMTYVIDRIGDKKAQSFGIWFKEYIVNIVVQLFHAVVYVLIVGAGVQSYFDTNGKTWLFMILSILFLFQGEKILRNIFGIKSSANTIGDLAATGAALYGMTKISGGGKAGSPASAQDKADVSDAAARQAQRKSFGASGAPTPPPSGGSQGESHGGAPGGGGSTSENHGQYTGNDPAGVEPGGYNEGAAHDTVIQKAMAKKIGYGIASKAVNFAGKAVGTVAGATYGMSKGDTADGSILKNALSDGVSGGMIGQAAVAPATAVVNKVEQKVHGEQVGKQIEKGAMDGALTLNAPPGAMMPPNVDPNEIVGKHGETMQEIYRKALAEMARVTATKGKARGEIAYWNYIEENTNNT